MAMPVTQTLSEGCLRNARGPPLQRCDGGEHQPWKGMSRWMQVLVWQKYAAQRHGTIQLQARDAGMQASMYAGKGVCQDGHVVARAGCDGYIVTCIL